MDTIINKEREAGRTSASAELKTALMNALRGDVPADNRILADLARRTDNEADLSGVAKHNVIGSILEGLGLKLKYIRPSAEQVVGTIVKLTEFGLSGVDLRNVLNEYPNILAVGASGLEARAKWWGGKDVFIELVERYPPIAGYSPKEEGGLEEKAKWWGGKDVFIELVKSFPQIAGYSPKEEGGLEEKAKWWGGKDVFIELVKRHPPIASYSPGNLEDTRRAIMVDKDMFVALACKSPVFVGFSAEGNIIPRLRYAKSLGMKILSIEDHLKVLKGSKSEFIKNLHGIGAENSKYEEFRNNVIESLQDARKAYIESLGGDPADPAYAALIKKNAPRFIDGLAKKGLPADLEEFLNFRENAIAN